MEEIGPIAAARSNFQEFIWSHDAPYGQTKPDSVTGAPADNRDYLQEYIEAWLIDGDGVEFTGGSYEMYLRVVIDIADVALRGRLATNYRGTLKAKKADAYEREVQGLHEPGYGAARALDRDGYEVIVYRRTHEGSGRLRVDYSQYRDEPDG